MDMERIIDFREERSVFAFAALAAIFPRRS
jgi:hypothetical protein